MIPGPPGDGAEGERRGARRPLTRRAFLRAALTAAVLASCRPLRSPTAPAPTSSASSTPRPLTATAPAPSRTPTSPPAPTPLPTAPPTPTATIKPTLPPPAAPGSRVAIARAPSYDRQLVREQVRALLDGLGGLADVVRPGDRVAVKVNLTGGAFFSPPAGLAATESYLTHPEVVRALLELVRDAGAREVWIVEAVYDPESYRRYGYEEVAEELGARLVDLNDPHPYGELARVPVGGGGFVYRELLLHPLLQEVDALISVAKMKCHCRCGVTLAMKNLIGLVPAAHYRLGENDWWRSALHGTDEESRTRLPRVILDLNRARPIQLALIDGVRTGEAGEVPRGAFAPVSPGVLVAGKDPVAADAVATAIMGFEPTAEYPAEPFVNGDNHLNLARELGLGTNRLEEIGVVGAAIEEVQHRFRPCYSEMGMHARHTV